MPKATLNPVIKIDLTVPVGTQKQYRIGGCNRVWLPKLLLVAGSVFVNPLDAVLAIRVNEQGGEQHPWAIQDGYVNQQSGEIESLWVTVLTKGAGNTLYLGAGTDVGVGYGDADGLSAQVPGPGTASLAPGYVPRSS